MRFPGVFTLLKKNFFAGLFVVAPFVVAAWLLGILVQTIWSLRGWLPEAWEVPDPNLAFLISAAFVIGTSLLLAFGISFIGWVSKQYLGQK
ncbi:MAG TPA: hypothetical protein VM598_02855, partial [Bdellovibrionota bacterium]|nr:hypothetical protein [Bdellovibrionota bacterium]